MNARPEITTSETKSRKLKGKLRQNSVESPFTGDQSRLTRATNHGSGPISDYNNSEICLCHVRWGGVMYDGVGTDTSLDNAGERSRD